MSVSDPFGNIPGQFVAFSDFELRYIPGSGSSTPGSSSSRSYPVAARMRSTNEKGMASRLPNGEQGWKYPTSFQRSISKFKCTTGTALVNYAGTPGWTDTYTFPSFERCPSTDRFNEFLPIRTSSSPHTYFDLNDLNRAEVEAMLKIRENRINIGENLATARQTADMLSKSVKRLVYLIQLVKRGNLSQLPKIFGFQVANNAGGVALEWRYGWKPLLSDIYETYNRLQNLTSRPFVFSVSRSIRNENQYFHTQYYQDLIARFEHTVRYKTTVKLWCSIDNAALGTADELGLANPLSLAWELIPYTFVLDWLIPIGNTLSALSATNGVNFWAGFRSIRSEGNISVKFDKDESFWPWNEYFNLSCDVENFSFRREPYGAFPIPGFYMKNPFSTGHVEAALALILSSTQRR